MSTTRPLLAGGRRALSVWCYMAYGGTIPVGDGHLSVGAG